MDAKQYAHFAMQSLLPGLLYATERSLESLNLVRSKLGLPRIWLATDKGQEYDETLPKAHIWLRKQQKIHEAPARRQIQKMKKSR